MNPENAPLLTVRDVADQLKLSIATVYEMIRQGTLPSIRVGARRGAIRIRQQDIDMFLESSEQRPAASKTTAISRRVKLRHIRL